MKRSTKYVALDVYQATTVASVRQEGGRVIARTILPTEEPALLPRSFLVTFPLEVELETPPAPRYQRVSRLGPIPPRCTADNRHVGRFRRLRDRGDHCAGLLTIAATDSKGQSL